MFDADGCFVDDGRVQVAEAVRLSEATASAWFAGRASLFKSLRVEPEGGVLLSNGGPLVSPCRVFSPNDAYMIEEFTPSKASITQLRQAAAVPPRLLFQVRRTMGGNPQDALRTRSSRTAAC